MMTEREMERLKRSLELLSEAAAYPPQPDIVAAVERRIAERPAPQRAPAWALGVLAIAAAAVVIAGVVAAVSPARQAVADLFERIDIFQSDRPSPGTPTEIEGEPVTLDQAEEALGFAIVLPSGDQPSPERLLLQDFGSVTAVAIFFEWPETGEFVIFQSDATAGKGLAPGASASPVDGVGDEAYWLEGLRIVQYENADGSVVEDSVRATDANTLLWLQDGRIFRIEGNLTMEQAVDIATSLR